MSRSPTCALVFLVAFSAACSASEESSVCEMAEDLAAECGEASSSVDFGECVGEVREAAEDIVELGCDGLRDAKGDVTSQLCIGPLEKFFPWCTADDYRCEPTADDLDPALCNGSAALCDRPYSEVVFATSHNAFSAASMGFLRPNQSKRMYVQLRDGMRALMIDSLLDDGELKMCHFDCALGQTSFVDGLIEVRDFLECHPNEVVTLIIEPHAEGVAHVEAIEAAGLAGFVHTHEPGTDWPTLAEMISAGERLVVLAEEPGEGTPPWYHHQWDVAFDNEFAVAEPADFACDVKRGEVDNELFGLNHFITRLGGDEFLSVEPNQAASIEGHVEQCREELGRTPSFIAVDFHDIGDIVTVVATLNGQ